MKRFRINPKKKELKELYETTLDAWYEHHKNAQQAITEICRSSSEDIDMAQELCRLLRKEAHAERLHNEELDRISKQLRSTRWIIFE